MRWRAMSSMSVNESCMAVLLSVWWLGSALVEGDVARGRGGTDLEVGLVGGGLARARQRGGEAAAGGADVGPHRGAGDDPDPDVPAGGLGGEPARADLGDLEIAGAGGEDGLAAQGPDRGVAGPGLDREVVARGV